MFVMILNRVSLTAKPMIPFGRFGLYVYEEDSGFWGKYRKEYQTPMTGFGWRMTCLATVDSATSYPRRISSDMIRGVPQLRFPLESWWINCWNSEPNCGQSGLQQDYHFQNSFIHCRCQQKTVEGLTIISADCQPTGGLIGIVHGFEKTKDIRLIVTINIDYVGCTCLIYFNFFGISV